MRDWYTKIVLSQIYNGTIGYKTEYGSPPSTSNNRELVRLLKGDNPRKIEFIYLKSRALNSAGDAIDRWGTPIRINLTDPNNPVVESAGPDRVWKTSDDLTDKVDFP